MLARTVIYNYHSCNRNIFLTTQYAYIWNNLDLIYLVITTTRQIFQENVI